MSSMMGASIALGHSLLRFARLKQNRRWDSHPGPVRYNSFWVTTGRLLTLWITTRRTMATRRILAHICQAIANLPEGALIVCAASTFSTRTRDVFQIRIRAVVINLTARNAHHNAPVRTGLSHRTIGLLAHSERQRPSSEQTCPSERLSPTHGGAQRKPWQSSPDGQPALTAWLTPPRSLQNRSGGHSLSCSHCAVSEHIPALAHKLRRHHSLKDIRTLSTTSLPGSAEHNNPQACPLLRDCPDSQHIPTLDHSHRHQQYPH